MYVSQNDPRKVLLDERYFDGGSAPAPPKNRHFLDRQRSDLSGFSMILWGRGGQPPPNLASLAELCGGHFERRTLKWGIFWPIFDLPFVLGRVGGNKYPLLLAFVVVSLLRYILNYCAHMR